MKQYIPIPQNNVAKKTATAMFVGALIIFAISGWRALPYRSALQMLSFALMTAAIMVSVRYLFRSYCYRVEACDDGYEFVVLELSKNLSHTVCRLSMSALLSIEPWTKDLEKEKKKEKRLKIYNYCVDIAPSDALLLTFADSTYSASDTPICLKIQSDADFRNTLSRFLEK